jgi:hypothetical protein
VGLAVKIAVILVSEEWASMVDSLLFFFSTVEIRFLFAT